MKFSDIPGSPSLKENLLHAIKTGKVAHAQLFSGPEGALQLPIALAFAMYLHCENKGDADSCGQCPACLKSLKYIHPDTHFVFPRGNILTDKDEDYQKAAWLKEWRSFLTGQPFGNLSDWVSAYGGEDKAISISREESREIIRALSLKSFESPYKVMIIWLPELMHPSASNGILKILEEPPPNTFFLLVTNDAEQLLPTILSRTQSVLVPKLSDEELEEFLIHARSVSAAQCQTILPLADGNLNLALSLLEAEEDSHQEVFMNWMRSCFKKDYAALVGVSEAFHGLDRLGQQNLLHYSLAMLRETILVRAGATSINRTRDAELKFAQDFSKVLDVSKIEKATRLIDDSIYFLDRNGSAKMIFLDLSLQVSEIINPGNS
jgi:DNA polymerase III subunit delta'